MEEPDDFVGFLQQLVDGDDLQAPAAGVAAMVSANGNTRNLSQAQHGALVAGVIAWIQEHFPDYDPPFVEYGATPPTPECTESGDEVPWCEVYVAGALNDGVCSYCMQVHHKDD